MKLNKLSNRKIAVLLVCIILLSALGIHPSAKAATEDKYTCYHQTDSRWESYPFGYLTTNAGNKYPAYIGLTQKNLDGENFWYGSGCSLLSLTNVVSALGGGFVDPRNLADYALNNGYRTPGSIDTQSMYRDWVAQNGASKGIKYHGFYPFNEDAKNHIKNGGKAIFNIVGHFVACVDYDSGTSKYLILDSAPTSSRKSDTNGGKVWVTENELKTHSKLKITYGVYLFSSSNPSPDPQPDPTPAPSSCSCQVSYEGLYKCTTASASLNIRDAHSTSGNKVGYIPSGATVIVTKANGSWAHVQYNGVSGCASMQYLKKIGDISSLIRISGMPIGYALGDTFKATGSGSAARQFADYCETAVYGESRTLVPNGFALFKKSNGTDMTSITLGSGWVVTLVNGSIYVVEDNDGSTIKLLSLGAGNVIQRTTMTKAQAKTFFTNNPINEIELWNNTGLGGGSVDGGSDTSNPTVSMPEIIIHIDNPRGSYDGSNHIEISGWIASKHSVTYIMGECEAFGQMNLTGSITDASAELDAAGYSAYPYKVRYRSVIDRKHLQPNTTYTMKVWAGMTNGVTSGVCSQKFDVTSIVPTVINITNPAASSFAGGKDVAVSGNILSLNPITDATARIADINGSTQVLNFDLDLKESASVAAGSSTYTYGYTFSGTMPLSLVTKGNTTASVFVTAIDENNIEKTVAKTFAIGNVVRGDINAYQFVYDQEYVRVHNTETHTLSGTVYANAPIADVMAQMYQWSTGGGIIMFADVTEVAPKSGYQYAKRFELKVSAGDLCDILGVDSFTDNEFRVKFWCDLVGPDGLGQHKEDSVTRTVFGNNVQMVKYTVNYNANGGSGGPTASQTFNHRKAVTLSSAIPTRTGYTFRGWTTSASSRQVKYVPGSTYNTNSNVTLYAVWQNATDIPTDLIDYDFTPSITIKNAPQVYKFVPSATTKYRFSASGSAGANVVIQNASGATVASMSSASSVSKEVMLNDNTVYYIVVKPNTANVTGTVKMNILRSYAINFDANGGSGAPSQTLYQFAGEEITLPGTVPTIDPITVTFDKCDGTQTEHECPVLFDGWANYDYRSFSIWEAGESVSFDRSLTLQAEWAYQSMDDLDIYDIPEKEGQIFCGWEDQNGFSIAADTVALQDETYYAQWKNAVELEGIKISPKSLALEVDDIAQLLVLPIPSNADLPETIWDSSNPDVVHVSQTGLVTVLSEGVSIITVSCDEGFSATATIIAGNPVFTIDYDANGGEGTPRAGTVKYGDAFHISTDAPAREGHIFLGWSDDAQAEQAKWSSGEALNVQGNMTLYAVWQIETYQVVYDANGGSDAPEAQTKIYGEDLVLSSLKPVREGFSFVGWTDEAGTAAKYAAGGTYSENKNAVLYAVWTENATSIRLNYSTLVMDIGASKALTAYLEPVGAANSAVRWSSSNDKVATVENGIVISHSAGKAVITCTVADDIGLSASCKVTVAAGSEWTGSENVPLPETKEITAVPGTNAAVEVKFVSENAAYAKLAYSYDESALELVSTSAAGTHVTLGNGVAVLAVSNGKIPDGTQLVLNFRVKDDAHIGVYSVDVAVVECYTIEEEDCTQYAAAADRVSAICAEHSAMLLTPSAATREDSGLSAGWQCALCNAVISEQKVIEAEKCLWLPDALKTIESEALTGVSAQQIVLGENAESIGSLAFSGCEELLLAVIPASVMQIADDAFEGCSGVCIITAEGSTAQQYAERIGLPCVTQ